jgi:hypothetical protein
MKKKLLVVFAVALPLMAGGCSMTESVVDRSMDVNESIADMESKTILLNILRAKDHMPMVFTGISGITFDSPSIEAKTELAIPFGGGSDHIYTVTPSFTSDYKLNYQVGVFQSEKFTRGIMTPVTAELFKYFWDMGFSKNLLLHLFVGEVRCYQIHDDSTLTLVDRFKNYPGDKNDYNKFSCEMHKMVREGLDLVSRECDLTKSGQVSAASGTEVKAETENNDLKRVVLFMKNPLVADKNNLLTKGVLESSKIFHDKYVVTLPPEIKDKSWEEVLGLKNDEKGNKKIAVLYLRSTESMIYYLGEIVREQMMPGEPDFTVDDGGGKKQHIFLVRQLDQSTNKKDVSASRPGDGTYPQCSQPALTESNDVLVKVKYNGKEYYVPKENGKTMEVMSLVSLLVGLNKSADEFPKTSVIQLTQ